MNGPASPGQRGRESPLPIDPWAAPPPSSPPAPETPESRQRRAEAALGRVAKIEPEVAKLRHLAFERAVPTKYQKPDEFRAFVRREIARELPAARSRDLTAALAHLGFLARPTDLAGVEEQAMTTQAGAYYDPAAKAFFVVMVPSSDLMLDTMSAHELTHALQDQHFDLDHFLPADTKLDDDAVVARRFVVEGDATLVMLLYTMRSMLGDQLTPAMVAALHEQIEKLAAQDVAALEAQVRSQSALFGGMDAEIQKSIDAMDDIPPAVLVPLLDSYMKGALVALTAYEHGGWAAVDALFRDPPSSSEQVLHPATKLYPVRERPHRVTLRRTADPELAGNVLGELQWKIYFDLWKVPHADEAAAGWGGDRYAVTRRRDGRLIGRIATIWDTPDDARQFADAYIASLATRFPGAAGQPAAGIARPDGGRVFVRVAGARVFIVDGADDASALDALIRSATFD
ncbi:MAG TPA: hypothetical protein VHW23_02850 [Kofleriaceae bacterium]|nr:hypothetical protein [Kofleriaceae bacterium]